MGKSSAAGGLEANNLISFLWEQSSQSMLCCVSLPRQDHTEPFPTLGHPWAPLGDHHGTVPSLAGQQEASLWLEKVLDCVNPGVWLLRGD